MSKTREKACRTQNVMHERLTHAKFAAAAIPDK